MTDEITWDEAPIQWDDNGQADKARDLVHGGQNSFFPNMVSASGKALVELARKLANVGTSASDTLLGAPSDKIGDVVSGGSPEAIFAPTTSDSSLRSFGSPEAIAKQEAEDKPVFDAPGGRTGQVFTDTAAGSLIGGPIDSALAGGTARLLGKSLAARAATRLVAGGGSGALNSAAFADPGQRGTAAAEGGVAGAGLGALEGTLKKSLATGLVKKSPDLLNLEGDVARANAVPGGTQRSLFVPVSQGADPDDMLSSVIGKAYKSALPYAPGVETQLTNQAKKAGNVVRESMLQTGAPDGYVVPPTAAGDMQLSTKLTKEKYDDIYEKLRQVKNVKIPDDFETELAARIAKADPQIPGSDVDAYVSQVRQHLNKQAENSADGKINGWNLKNVRDNVQAMNGDLPMPQRAGMTNTAKSYIDDMFGDKLKQAFNLNHQSTQDILTAYKTNAPNYENFRPLQESVRAYSKKRGEFPFGNVSNRANDMTDIQGMDQDAFSVLGQKPSQTSQQGRILGYGAVGGASLMAHGVPLIPAAIVTGGANALATKTVQKGLYGDMSLQKSIKALIENNPKLAQTLGYTLPAGVTSEIGVEN